MINPALVLFEQSVWIDLEMFLSVRSLTEIWLFWYPFQVLPVELLETSYESVDFLLTEKIKRDNQGIIISFYYLIQISQLI